MSEPVWSARMDGWRIDILRDGEVVGSGRWTGDAIADCTVQAYPNDPAREAELHREWVRSIEAEVSAALAAAPPSHNEDGVDLLLVDWMLSLTPLERLEALQTWINTFGEYVEVAG